MFGVKKHKTVEEAMQELTEYETFGHWTVMAVDWLKDGDYKFNGAFTELYCSQELFTKVARIYQGRKHLREQEEAEQAEKEAAEERRKAAKKEKPVVETPHGRKIEL